MVSNDSQQIEKASGAASARRGSAGNRPRNKVTLEGRSMRRVSWHQSVFDLLGVQPQASPEARAMIEACEARTGRPLPAAVRDWFVRENVVALRGNEACLWNDYSNDDRPLPLERVLRWFSGEDRIADDEDDFDW